MELVLVAPGLLALAPEALGRDRTLSRIAGAAEAVVVDDIDQALLGILDAGAASAPFAALGAGIDPAGRFLIRADPVTMRVTHDDVRIAARVDDLDACESATLVTLLDAHFAAERYADFCDSRLRRLDEVAWEWFGGAAFDDLLVQTVRELYPPHEHEQFVSHFRGLVGLWLSDESGRLARGEPQPMQ